MRFRAPTFLFCLLLLLGSPSTGEAQTNGIFADFQTSLGDFTCGLDFTNAPMTVANFIGLAEGERNWLNLETGKVERRPFYDGLTFHRVVTNFVIQTGSREGDGSDGPGYTFRDEFSTNALHGTAGALSMANSGLNSNGSQIFVTLRPTPELDFVHSVFGRVTSGMNVVSAIGVVPVDGDETPLTPVVLQQVVIRRVGAEAQNFNVHAYGLPEIQPAPVDIRSYPNGVQLQFPTYLDHEYLLYFSSALSSWESQRVDLFIDEPPPGDLVLNFNASSSPRLNFHVPEIHFPGPLYTPETVRGRDFLLRLNSVNLLVISVDETGGVIYQRTTLDGTPIAGGSFSTSVWAQHAYRGILWIPNTSSPIIKLHFEFEDAGGGFFRGSYFGPTYQGPFFTMTQ